MEDLKQYYLFGGQACTIYSDYNVNRLLVAIRNGDIKAPFVKVYEYDDSLNTSEDIMQSFRGFDQYAMISKADYDLIEEALKPVSDQYLICWTEISEITDIDSVERSTDNYHMADGLEEARTFYNGLLNDRPANEIYSASMCAVIESTDYTTHPLLKKLR